MSPKGNRKRDRALTRFQADVSPREAQMLDRLKAELDIRSNAELLTESVAIVRWLVRERRFGRMVASFSEDDRPLHELVSSLLERVAPEHDLPYVQLKWTETQLASLAELTSADPAPPTEALVRAMRRR